jgi:hypothetical protein
MHNTTTTPADRILSAMEDAERLVPHAFENQRIMSQELNRKRLLAALGNPIAEGAEFGQPLLRSCDPALPGQPLILGLMAMDRQTSTADCERHTGYGYLSTLPDHRPGVHRLMVGMGASVVIYHVCGECRVELDEHYVEPRLVWDY